MSNFRHVFCKSKIQDRGHREILHPASYNTARGSRTKEDQVDVTYPVSRFCDGVSKVGIALTVASARQERTYFVPLPLLYHQV